MNGNFFTIESKILRRILLLASVMCIGTVSLRAQGTVTGTVTDANGAVSNVTVTVKGTSVGVLSGINGKYSINLPAGDVVLVFSYVGYVTQEIAAGGRSVIDVVLTESSETLDDVVVVGYGTQTKATLTGAVVAIGSKELTTTKTASVQNSLTGKIPGLKIVQRNSEPGGATDDGYAHSDDFTIRGMGKPLIVIDGVPRDNMTRMDANEIESISILKDASAAIYGTRAANGVVLITTKKGKRNEKFKFDYTGYVGGKAFLYDAQLLDAIGYMSLMNELRANGYQAMLYSEDNFKEYDPVSGTKKSTDWWNPYIKDFPLQTQHSFSATGGGEVVDYFLNFGYYNQQGMWKTNSSKYDRFNLRSNVTARLGKNLKAEVLLNLMRDNKLQQPQDTWRVLRAAYSHTPLEPEYVNDDINYPYDGIAQLIDMDKGGYRRYIENMIQTNLALEYSIPWVEGLKARGMYSIDYKIHDRKWFSKPYVTYNTSLVPSNPTGYIQRYYKPNTNTLMQLSLDYARTFGKHRVSGLVLYEESDRESDQYQIRRPLALDGSDNLAFSSSDKTADNFRIEVTPADLYHYANKAVVGRFSYDYDSKYLLDFSFRYDGSSRFAPGHQWGFFPSVSGGWRLSEEEFVKKAIPFMNNLKLRASYGVMGDDGAAAYQFYQGYTYPAVTNLPGRKGYYMIDGKVVTALGVQNTLPNEKLTWIEAETVDIGIDVEFWNGLLGATADVFRRDRSGMLAQRSGQLPGEVGAGMPQENLNSDMSMGYEIALTHRNTIGDFSYNVGANIAFTRTKSLHWEVLTPYGNSYADWKNNMNDRWKNYDWGDGYSNTAANNIFWGVDYLGQYGADWNAIFSGPIYDGKGNSTVLPGDPIYEDWNGDGQIDASDEHPIYNQTLRQPFLTYGFTIGAEWKGFDLNMVFNGVGMSRIRLGGAGSYRSWFEGPFTNNSYGGVGGNGWDIFLDRWHRADESNPSKWQDWVPGEYPSTWIGNGRNGNVLRNSSLWIYNANYLRLKSLEVGYTIPAKLTDKIGIDRLRVFFNAYNLLTFTKFPFSDPERITGDGNKEFQGRDGMEYPLNKTYNLGINLSF